MIIIKTTKAPSYREIFFAQLRVGSVAFGGALSALGLMRNEFVERRAWVSEDRYLEGLGIVKFLPGPISSLMAAFIGLQLLGPLGATVSLAGFVLPSFLMILAIVGLQDLPIAEFGANSFFSSTMAALQGAVIGVVLSVCWTLLRDSYKRSYRGHRRPAWVVFFSVGAGVAAWCGVAEIFVLMISALLGSVVLWSAPRSMVRVWVDPLTIYFVFLKAGLLVWGTGYMILPYLQRELVEHRAWLTAQQFSEGFAWGNLTPGPIVISSTYFGFMMGSWPGAVAATLGMFMGPLFLMIALAPVLKRILGRPWLDGVLLGLLPAVASSIGVASFFLLQKMNLDWPYYLAIAPIALTQMRAGRVWPLWKSLLLVVGLHAVVYGVWFEFLA